LPNPSRLDLWQKTIAMFHDFPGRQWKGPFAKAGYHDYRVEALLLNPDGEEGTPDVVAVSQANWALCELTISGHSKATALTSYQKISPRELPNHGLRHVEGRPSVLSVRLAHVDDGAFAQVILGDALQVNNVDAVEDPVLRGALVEASGTPLNRFPQVPITILPECSSNELREGLIPIIAQLFAPSRPALSAMDMVEQGLDKLSTRIPVGQKSGLRTRVQREMDALITGPDAKLGGDLEIHEGRYRAREGVGVHHLTLARVGRALKEWSGKTTRLEDFIKEPDE
jgi:hypothetical protein